MSAKRSRQPASCGRAKAVRRSVFLEPDVDALAHELAGRGDFSSFVNEALRREIQRRRMSDLLDDLDDRFGAPSDAATAKAEALWRAQNASEAPAIVKIQAGDEHG